MKQLISSRNIKVVLAVVLAITCINGIGLNLNDHPIQVPDGTSSPQSKTTSTSSIPDYTGLASVVLSDGSGLDISDLPSETVLSELQEFACSISRKDLQDLADLAMQVYRNPDELPFTYFRPIRDRLYSWGVDAIKDAQAVMYLGRGDYDSYQIARNDLEDSGWLSPEIEINSLDKIPLGEYLQAGISKMESTDWA